MKVAIPIKMPLFLTFREKLKLFFLNTMLLLKTGNTELLIELGKFHFVSGNHLTAEECFALAARTLKLKDPITRAALYCWARCLQIRDKHKEASAVLCLLAEAEQSQRVYIALALSYEHLEMYDQMQAVGLAAYLLDPLSKDKRARLVQGRAALLQKNFHYARIIYQEIVRSDKVENLQAYQLLIEALCNLKQHEEAIKIAEEMVFTAIDNAEKLRPDIELSKSFLAVAFRLQKTLRNKPLGYLAEELARVLKPSVQVTLIPLEEFSVA